MSDELKKFLTRELNELKKNKIRTIALGVCAVVLMGTWLLDNMLSEDITLNNTPPATKDLPVTSLSEKNSDGVTPVIGANPDPLIIADPFAVKLKSQPPPQPVTLPPPLPVQPPPTPQPSEKILLTGTAVGEKNFAMFLRGNETIFLSVGDEISGRRIVDIKPDVVTFADGTRLSVQKELN